MSGLKAPNQVGTSTVTNTSNVPPYVSNAQQYLLNNAINMTAPFMSPPADLVAGLTPKQTEAMNSFQQIAEQQAATSPINVSSYGSWNYNPTMSTASQLSPDEIRQFFNPYQKDIVNTTTQQLQEANDKQLAAIRARQAAEGAYGGNRGALQESEQNRNFGNTLASTVAGLNYGGYNTAAGLGMQNAGMRQQTGLANQAAANQAGAFNAQSNLNAAAEQNNLNNAQWQRTMSSLQALLGAGNQEQDLAQRALDAPFRVLGIMGGATPQTFGTTSSSSTPIYGPSMGSTLGTVASLGLGALSSFSDETMKKDKDKLGKHPAGFDIYSYRWKGQPSTAPKSIGPMAQDVERKVPGSTMRIGGKLAIKGSARAMLGI